MTTIAYDGASLAADGRARTSWGSITSETVEKIRTRDGVVFATAGDLALFEPLIAWFRAGADAKAVPVASGDDANWTLVVITPKEAVFYTSKSPYPLALDAPWTGGSGSDLAMGAMEFGATAEEAVRIAIKRDSGSGGRVTCVKINDIKPFQEANGTHLELPMELPAGPRVVILAEPPQAILCEAEYKRRPVFI